MDIFGDTLGVESRDWTYAYLNKIIKNPLVRPRYKITILNPDETTNYEIPSSDIPLDGISYTEDYQNGQRRSITLKLINEDGKYTPSINNNIWLHTKFRFDIGLETPDTLIWFPRGIYVMGNISSTYSASGERTVELSLKDKFSIFEDKLGTLEEAYEIEVGSNIEEALRGLMNFDAGNGYVFDYKPIILDPSFIGKTTQSTIRVEEGGNLGKIIEELATQLSAEYYYNTVGNLCFYQINETIRDFDKPVIWVFDKLNRELHNYSLNYKNEDVINVVKVIGDNIENGVHSAIVVNDNPASPICIGHIGRRAAAPYNESNIWSTDLAEDLANYYLRQSTFIATDFSCNVAFNPILFVNNIVEVENDFLNLKRDKLLITSISYSSNDGLMSLKMSNTSDLPFVQNSTGLTKPASQPIVDTGLADYTEIQSQ